MINPKRIDIQQNIVRTLSVESIATVRALVKDMELEWTERLIHADREDLDRLRGVVQGFREVFFELDKLIARPRD